jgi:hypothetical protein
MFSKEVVEILVSNVCQSQQGLPPNMKDGSECTRQVADRRQGVVLQWELGERLTLDHLKKFICCEMLHRASASGQNIWNKVNAHETWNLEYEEALEIRVTEDSHKGIGEVRVP